MIRDVCVFQNGLNVDTGHSKSTSALHPPVTPASVKPQLPSPQSAGGAPRSTSALLALGPSPRSGVVATSALAVVSHRTVLPPPSVSAMDSPALTSSASASALHTAPAVPALALGQTEHYNVKQLSWYVNRTDA